MITSVNDWITFLRSTDSAIAFPLVICGLGLMLFGWRMWKACVVLAFGLIGAVAGGIVAGQSENQAMFAIVGAVLFGVVSSYPVRQALAVLGGLIGVGVTHFYISPLILNEIVHWSLCATAFIVFAGYSLLSKQRVVIFVTAFLGAVLLMSGLAAWVMSMPVFFDTVRALTSYSMIVVPFLLVVPAAMSCFYQIAEVHRLQLDL